MTDNEKAIKVLKSKDIQAHEDYNTVYISVGDMELNISDKEIQFQASEYCEDTHE